MFGNDTPGRLVEVVGTDPRLGGWEHRAFVPDPLPAATPSLSATTQLRVADARAALAALDSTARRLPNPHLLRQSALRKEAQSTSALEGTFEPLRAVLTTTTDDVDSPTMREVLNYVRVADHAFAAVGEGRPISVVLLTELQGLLVQGTPSGAVDAGQLRTGQVVIGRRSTAPAESLPVHAARFVPAPPGTDLEGGVHDLVSWLGSDHRGVIDPVVQAAMGHYQFEALHPFRDGNGRVGRLLIVLQLLTSQTLGEPTLTVSPWFEARRDVYYDRLLAVSTTGDWDAWVSFFAQAMEESAAQTHHLILDLVAVQSRLQDTVRHSSLRADTARQLVDFAMSRTVFTVRQAQQELPISYGRANALVSTLVEFGVLAGVDDSFPRRFYAPDLLAVLLGESG